MNDKPKSVDIKTIDMELLEKLTTKDPHIIPYAHHRGGVAVVPTDISASKIKAYEAMVEQTEGQLGQIFEQMQLLAKQAKGLQDRIDVSKMVYQADYKFTPVIGECYYLYEIHEVEKYQLSLISPKDWGKEKMESRDFISKVKLLADHTWKVLD